MIDPIQRDFEAYHEEFPDTYRAILRFAGEVREAGYTRYSIAAIFERIRWHYTIERRQKDWKINNNYRSRYARLVMAQEPEYEGFFEIRELRTRMVDA